MINLWYQISDRIDNFETPKEKLDVIRELLSLDEISEDIKAELRNLYSNIILHSHLQLNFPVPVKPKKVRAPRVKKPVVDAPAVKSSAEPTADQA